MDNDYNYILFEFSMNYSLDSMRHGYIEARKKESERISDDVLRKLGYTDSDLIKRND